MRSEAGRRIGDGIRGHAEAARLIVQLDDQLDEPGRAGGRARQLRAGERQDASDAQPCEPAGHQHLPRHRAPGAGQLGTRHATVGSAGRDRTVITGPRSDLGRPDNRRMKPSRG